MENVFLRVLNMSAAASVVIAAVVLLRLALRRLPKKVSYLLWSVVAFRLCCPVSWQSVFSLFSLKPLAAASTLVQVGTGSSLEYFSPSAGAAPPQAGADAAQAALQTGQTAGSSLPGAASVPGADPVQLLISIGAAVWCAGLAALLVYSVVCYMRMKRQMRTAVLLRDNIYQSDRIRSPFLLGLLRPKIYIPFGLEGDTLRYVLAHERYHIRRRDYLIKPFAFLLLAVHWFNPLCWLAFCLMSRDMEMSCDEKVLGGEGSSVKGYSLSLLSFAADRRFPAPSPLSFGEAGVKGRIKNVLHWRKPKAWVTVLAVLLCILAVAACAANPAQTADGGESDAGAHLTGQYASMEDFAAQTMAAAQGTYFSISQGDTVTADVLATKLERLEKTGEVTGLAPEGTLESWKYCYLVQLDADPDDVAAVDGVLEDGWFDLEGGGGHNVVALRYDDGSYDILYDQPVNDGLDFYGYHNSYEEAIYDWYVTEYGLDLPLYVIDLLPYDELGNHPAHRYDGDGWYLYVPIAGWEQTEASGDRTVWSSLYGTGSTLTVRKLSDGEQEIDSSQLSEGQTVSYYASSDGTWCVFTSYTPETITGTDNPYISIEPTILDAMAASFTVDARFASTDTSAASDESSESISQTLTGYITIQDGLLTLDEIEIITPEDTDRIEELGLTLQGDLINGYYFYNEDESTRTFALTDKTEYRFVDIGQLYTTYDEENGLNYTTTSLEEFLAGSSYSANTAGYEASLESGAPSGRIPYFVEVQGNTVLSITEDFGYTM